MSVLDSLQSDNLDEAYDLVNEALEHIEHANDCETMRDYLGNLRELVKTAEQLLSRAKDALAVAIEANEE